MVRRCNWRDLEADTGNADEVIEQVVDVGDDVFFAESPAFVLEEFVTVDLHN